MSPESKPVVVITMGDVAGIGPEIIAKAWPKLAALARPVVVGDPGWMQAGIKAAGSPAQVQIASDCRSPSGHAGVIACRPVPTADLAQVQVGQVSSAAGQASYDWLCAAIDATLAGQAAAIVTCPIHKEGLAAAGIKVPGHTEILAERTGAKRHAMVLFGDGVGVFHVTLHVSVRQALDKLSVSAIGEAIDLAEELMPRLIGRRPRIVVGALNPHAGDGGLFGDEEQRVIAPAVNAAIRRGKSVVGPVSADAMWVRTAAGEFDAVVAMIHDHGHIPMKLRSGRRAVNITAGLPIVRTSVAHGTAYDIAGRGVADESSLIEAMKVAVKLAGNS